jgi:hypothetical protein
MTVISTSTRVRPSFQLKNNAWLSLPLAVAHVLAALALWGFGGRAGGYPLSPAIVYGHTAVTLLTLLALNSILHKPRIPCQRYWLYLTAPAALSLILCAGHWLGGATYFAWCCNNREVMWEVSVLFAATAVGLAIYLGSRTYLLALAAVQIPLGLLSAVSRPYVWEFVTFMYMVGFTAVWLRRSFTSRKRVSSWWVTAVSNILGGFLLYATFAGLPHNGQLLGYAGTTVPHDAWNSLRMVTETAALGIIILGIGMLLVRGISQTRHPR